MGSPGGALVQLVANDSIQNSYLTGSNNSFLPNNLLNPNFDNLSGTNTNISSVACELICVRQQGNQVAYQNCMSSCQRLRNLVPDSN